MKSKNIFIFGLGESGESAIKYFMIKKDNFLVWDDNYLIRNKIKRKYKKINIINPKDVNWEDVSFVLLSPGISLNQPILNFPNKSNIPFYRDLEIFSKNVNSNKVIAVTGTNGKSTTVSLIGQILSTDNKNIFVGGNLKPPLLEALKYES